MGEKIKKTEPLTAKRLSLASVVFFLIGTLYYSYIHIESAYYTMVRFTPVVTTSAGADESKLELGLSDITTEAVLGALLALIMCLSTVMLIIFALKNKLHILSAVLSAAIIALQLELKQYTLLAEYTFARNVLNLGNVAYDIGIPIKYIPFVIALILSVVSFAVAVHSHKPENRQMHHFLNSGHF